MRIFRLLLTNRLLRADRRAVTAVEFAMIGPMVLLFFIGFLLMGVYQFWQLALDDAVRDAARQVETGHVTTGTEFVNAVCAEFGDVAPCSSSNLSYEVQSASTFGGITPATVSSSTGQLSTSGTSFPTLAPPTNGGQPLLFQVTYTPPLPLPPLLPYVMMTGNPSPSLVSAVALMAY